MAGRPCALLRCITPEYCGTGALGERGEGSQERSYVGVAMAVSATQVCTQRVNRHELGAGLSDGLLEREHVRELDEPLLIAGAHRGQVVNPLNSGAEAIEAWPDRVGYAIL